jgi:hypothetical protein
MTILQRNDIFGKGHDCQGHISVRQMQAYSVKYKFASLKKKHARGIFAAAEDLFNAKKIGDIFA